ncbi:MAG: hypothetical protein HKN67_03165 [Saprospiraceae bacterium]|nr:hypothetical protein [Bacteroidia bacterium]MBT8230224.1 hypothetical protein [Bacteroidia bacterium]NNF20916.1 hypothetical protein [Saprospiraceae bacterium]
MNNYPEDPLSAHQIRPRFQIDIDSGIKEIEDKIKDALQEEDATCLGRVDHGFVRLMLPYEDQHYWSPQLSLNLLENGDKTHIRGLYGPSPSVWTMFIFFYALIGLAILVILIFGTSYISLDQSGAILWLIPVLVLIFASLYLVSFFGQRLGHDQIVILHNFLEKTLEIKFEDKAID